MLGVMEKQQELKNIPSGYAVCFNGDCQQRDRCLHYLAYVQNSPERLKGPAVLPAAWAGGHCQCFGERIQVRVAWGFNGLYKNVPHYLRAEARRCVSNYFSHGCGPYYRYHHGENKLSPRQQADIMAILAKFGSTEGLTFDHYETAYDFT